MSQDDGLRTSNGVVACLREVEGGKLRLIFDDVVTDNPCHPASWKTEMLFTFNDYDKDKMSSLELTKEDFAMIGENLVLRLLVREGLLNET